MCVRTGKGREGLGASLGALRRGGLASEAREPACHLSLWICPKDSSCEKQRCREAYKGVAVMHLT